MTIISLNQSLIPTLECKPGARRTEYCDQARKGLPGLPGLLLEVRPSGASTYYLRYKSDGQTKYIKLGTSDLITLAQARAKGKTLKAEIALGADPRGEANAKKAVLTYAEFFENHYMPYITPRKRSFYSDESLYRLRLKETFGNQKLTAITKVAIQSLHTKLMAEGLAAATCNHYIKLIKHSLNLAIDWNMLEKNPASRIPLYLEDNKKEVYLSEDQLQSLMTVLRTDANRPVCLIAIFLLSTGCRLNEALSAKWSDIDKGTRVWRILASNSKSKKIRSVPLNNSALEVLGQLDTATDNFEYLFRSRLGGRFTTITKAFDRIRRRAGLPFLNLHLLRHQHASFLVNSGRTIYEVKQLLGHSDIKTTERYAHLSTKTLQAASDCASTMIQNAMKSKPVEVVQKAA